MKHILKYTVFLGRVNTLILPTNAKIVRFAAQGGGLFIWAESKTYNTMYENVDLMAIGTGHDIHDAAEHIASCEDGAFIWHLYHLGRW